jgi:hypothetical protein
MIDYTSIVYSALGALVGLCILMLIKPLRSAIIYAYGKNTPYVFGCLVLFLAVFPLSKPFLLHTIGLSENGACFVIGGMAFVCSYIIAPVLRKTTSKCFNQ